MKKALIGLLIIIVALVVVISTRPSTFHVERSIEIGAPADIPYAMIADFHRWDGWSPWEKLDPNMKRTHEGPESGVGAKYHWVGNDDVGEGRMTITEAKPGESVGIDLEFIAPMESKNTTTFTFASAGDGTKVTWAMDGNNNFVGKAFGLFMDIDAMVGADFQRGLENLKSTSEAEAEKKKQAEAEQPSEPAAADQR